MIVYYKVLHVSGRVNGVTYYEIIISVVTTVRDPEFVLPDDSLSY